MDVGSSQPTNPGDAVPVVVVGAAIVDGGAVLAAQREHPAALAGRWEFPGGRVEVGEDERGALIRECREELGASVRVLGRLGPDLVLSNGWLLRIHVAELVGGQRPAALEHRSLRWVRGSELETLNWLDADRAVLPALRALLADRST
jgi:8-oxo-dGTP diphosphatase